MHRPRVILIRGVRQVLHWLPKLWCYEDQVFLAHNFRKVAIKMPNKEIVVDGQKVSLKEEARVLFEQYVTDCLQHAKAPAKQLAFSFVEELFNFLIRCARQKFAA